MKRKYFTSFLIIAGLYLFSPDAFAMHISEGILPLRWAGLWSLAALPFLFKGGVEIKKKVKLNPALKPLLGLMGAVVFVISCMPVPVPTAGTCSHPAGTGISAILIGPWISVFITSIALFIQALFLAHGGLTTWGADIISMGVAGSFAGYTVFKLLRKMNAPLFFCGFMAGLFADWATYLATSFELASALCANKPLLPLLTALIVAFIPTQLPLGILEGFLTGGMMVFVAQRRPDILAAWGALTSRPAKVNPSSKKIAVWITALLCGAWILCCHQTADAENRWQGVDETIVEKTAREHGRSPRPPFINTDQGDLLLFVFLASGTAGGFILGYCWRALFVEKKT